MQIQETRINLKSRGLNIQAESVSQFLHCKECESRKISEQVPNHLIGL